MNIETVKDLENSYLVNGSTTVPKDSTNSDYKKVQDWIAEGNTPDPEFTPAELLENAKKDKIAEIKKAKEIDLYLNVSYNNKDFISSEKAVSNMTGAIILDQDNYNWLDAGGNSVTMTVNDLKNLVGIIATQRSLVYNKEATKIKEINDAQTIEEINLIDWNLSLAFSPAFSSGVRDS
jgi:hypothetical protein